MSDKFDDKGNLHHSEGTTDGGKFAKQKQSEQPIPLGATGTRRRSAEELGIHESILMAPCNQQETYEQLHAALQPYRQAVDRLGYLAAAQASGDQEAIDRLTYGSNKADALEISGEFFAETFKILNADEVAPYWERASLALEEKDDFELNRALLEASLAEEDAHPVRLDPTWRRPGVQIVDGHYESKKIVGDKLEHLEDHNIATINKLVRRDIDAAKAAGWLPANLDLRVRKPNAISMAILVSSVPDEVKYVPDPHYEDRGWTTHHPAVKEIESRLSQIAQQYGSFENDTQQDFYQNSFYVNVAFK